MRTSPKPTKHKEKERIKSSNNANLALESTERNSEPPFARLDLNVTYFLPLEVNQNRKQSERDERKKTYIFCEF